MLLLLGEVDIAYSGVLAVAARFDNHAPPAFQEIVHFKTYCFSQPRPLEATLALKLYMVTSR